MTETEFLTFVRASATLATQTPGTIGDLILTQESIKGEPTLREPELRTALQLQASVSNILYGIEVPTRYSYRFTGRSSRKALTDIALLSSADPYDIRSVLIELKEGQPTVRNSTSGGLDVIDVPAIRKDMHKLLAEPVMHGRCMLHICQATNDGTLRALIPKYDKATLAALGDAEETRAAQPEIGRRICPPSVDPWFRLVFLVLHQRGKKFANMGSCLHIGSWEGDHWKVNQDNCFP